MTGVYALHQCADGRWLALGRDYRPWGEDLTGWVDYETCPGLRLRIPDHCLRRIDGGARPYRPGEACVYLYHDGSAPHSSAAAGRAYRDRLAVLTLAARNTEAA